MGSNDTERLVMINLEELAHTLASSSTKRRNAGLASLRQWLLDNETPQEVIDISIDYLFRTYPYYIDRPSRRAVQDLLRNPRFYPPHTARLVDRYSRECGKKGLAPVNDLVLLEWGTHMVHHSARDAVDFKSYGQTIVVAVADALETCLASKAKAKKNVKLGAARLAELAVATVSRSQPESVVQGIVEALTSKSSALGSRAAPFLGAMANVLLPHSYALDPVKGQIYGYYVREILGSRTLVPAHIASGLKPFFHKSTTVDDLRREIIPSLEKSLLRAPEVVLQSVISPLLQSLSEKLDLTYVLFDSLLKPLLADAKSQNETIRDGAISAYALLASRCHSEEGIQKISKQLLDVLLQSKTTSERQCVAQMLRDTPGTVSDPSHTYQSLTRLASKETSEGALAAEIDALFAKAHHLPFDSPALSAVNDAIVKGAKEKKPTIRRLWMLGVASYLWQKASQSEDENPENPVSTNAMVVFQDTFDQLLQNPLAAAQNGLAVVGYIVTALAPRIPQARQVAKGSKSSNLLSLALCDGPQSFLINYKVYSKVDAEDLPWLIRALVACAEYLNDASTDARTAWGEVFVYTICARTSSAVQRLAMEQLAEAYRQNRRLIGDAIIQALWKWYFDTSRAKKDLPSTQAKVDYRRLLFVLRCICSPATNVETASKDADKALREDQLINLLVLCRPEIIPGAHWIDVSLGTGVDPGLLAQNKPSECIERIEKCLEASTAEVAGQDLSGAAYSAAAELAFVAPDTIIPLLMGKIRRTLSVEALNKFGPTEIAISRTPEGKPFVDVLSNQSQKTPVNKNSPDYEIAKWEEDMRSKLAKKKGQEKKLTADQKAKIQAQLDKESEIRLQVNAVARNLRTGAGYIRALAMGPPTDAKLWLGPSLTALLGVIRSGADKLVGDDADVAYLACADLVTTRLGAQKRFIGISTLRIEGSPNISDDLLQEPLQHLVARILHRAHFLSAQRPFDVISLTYVLPLVIAVLRGGGAGECDEEAADEQITLALEILEFHTSEFADVSLPRQDTLGLLISCMQRYNQHYKLVRDCLMGIGGAIAPTIVEAETKVFLQGAIAPQQNVRVASLQAIRNHIDLTDMDFCEELWLACHDDIEDNAILGQTIWQDNALDADTAHARQIIPYLQSTAKPVRSAASRALAECIGDDTAAFAETLHHLEMQYRELAKPRAPEKDAFGMPKKVNLEDPWQARHGIALAFKELAPAFDPSELAAFIDFLINDGAVGDRSPIVREEMVNSAATIIGLHGASRLDDLMEKFEASLGASEKDEVASDLVSEAVVILYGSLARHLPNGDPKVPQVVNKLLSALATPSETVQYAVANCLPHLVRTSTERTSDYIQTTLDTLLQSKKYATRRGGAYGLAGIVKGRGVSSLRDYRVMSSLKVAIENKKDQNHRQGALFAYELLALLLGRTFEPYIIQIVPQLLVSFGDAAADVREACLDSSKTCFSHLSSYGVKLILPTLLEGLEESQWRSKRGACELLGAMAYLDPQQLASSLPEIIPPLTNVLNDSHKEVRAAANRSLQRFGEVISNPEIKGLVNILLKALSDPTKYTEDALEALIKVSFVHYLDSPSLALIVRILQRGLSDRSATKRKSAQIIGSLAHLTERRDVISHLPVLVAGLRSAIVDPVPATRATGSKALGSLVEKLGEDALPDLIPSLMNTLKANTGAGDRLGSAQALSEVLAGLGTGRLEDALPTILQNATSSKSTVREGFMTMFIYLPACFGNSFANYLSRVIPPILSGLADEIESIRESALRAGRLLVKNFATKSIDLLLPELDRGLADHNYRIRLSSVELVGDLLFNLTGISGKTEQDEEEVTSAPEAGQSLLEVLGEEKRNKILSSLYICRCDTSGLVKGAALNIWKALVATPRTLKELVPTLSQLIIRRLASSNMEQKLIAGNALGELIRKAGEGVLASLLPTLEEGLRTSTDVGHRQGICIALREITAAASPEALEDYEKTLIGVVRIALVDSDDEVREAAAEAFDSLQQILGKKAVDQVLPNLLNLLRSDEDANTALSALLTLLTDNTRSNIILPNLIPTLLVSPVSAFNARAIASLAKVAGPAMNRRLPNALNTLMENIVACNEADRQNTLEESFDTILLSVDEYDGLNTMMSLMLALVKNADHHKRANTNMRLSNFFAKAQIDFSRYYPDLIRVLLISFDDSDADVVRTAWQALSGLTQRLKKEEMESLVLSTRQTLLQVGVAGANLPGFLLPKGINAILPIFLQGLINGTADQKSHAALAISDIVDRTNTDSLKPFVTQITGPLIRVMSERSTDVKAAILLTLNNLLEKISILLKPFLPQLQRTFAKCLADPTSEILRSRAAKALGTLITLTPRIDPLIAELVTGSKTPDPAVHNATLKALFEVVSKAGGNMSETSRNSILTLLSGTDTGTEGTDLAATTHARVFGALIKSFPKDANPIPLLKQRVLSTTHLTPSSILNLNSVLQQSPSSLLEPLAQETATVITAGLTSKTTFIADNAILAAGKYLLSPTPTPRASKDSIICTLATLIPPGNPIDTRRLSLVVIRTISRLDPSLTSPHISILALPTFASVRDTVIPVKLAAEAAFLQLFQVVEKEGEVFDAYLKGEGGMAAGQKRSMQDYFKRVAVRLAAQARERKEAEGGQGALGLTSDEVEDEREVWNVGRLEVGDKTFAVE